MENRLKVQPVFRFPMFKELCWHAAVHYLAILEHAVDTGTQLSEQQFLTFTSHASVRTIARQSRNDHHEQVGSMLHTDKLYWLSKPMVQQDAQCKVPVASFLSRMPYFVDEFLVQGRWRA